MRPKKAAQRVQRVARINVGVSLWRADGRIKSLMARLGISIPWALSVILSILLSNFTIASVVINEEHLGLRAMRREGGVFYDMPTNFGMNGATMPGQSGVVDRGDVFGARRFGGPGWWRPPGYFSGPLLANPHFRKEFLARTKEILETIYTVQTFGPIIDDLGDRLSLEVEYRAGLVGGNRFEAMLNLEEHLEALHAHLKLRREFLLEQPEIALREEE